MSVFAGQPALTGVDVPLVSIDDFTEWFQITSPSDADNARIQTALEIASGVVRSGRRYFTAINNDQVTVDGSGVCDILLPRDRLPVRSVAAVTNTATGATTPVSLNAAEYDWTASGILRLHRDASIGPYWTMRRGGVTVTYSHGYDPVPRAVLGVVLSVAKRLYDNPAGSVVRSETIGDYAVTYDATAGGLLPHEELVLKDYEVVA